VAFLVPLVLLGVALLLAASSHFASRRRAAKEQVAREVAADKPILVHSINDDRCVGCDACVAVCPTDVLELVGNKAKVLRFGDCIQCEQCMWACPTQALVMHRDDAEPPPIKMPNLDPYYQTDVEGMYLVGEVAGKPLVKNAANAGRAVVEDMRRRGLRPGRGEASSVDVLIVGSGPAGLSAALTCLHHGLRYVVIEKETVIASTIARYPKGKDVMVEPYDAKNVSFLPVFDSRKEDLLPVWQALFDQVGLSVRTNETVLSIDKIGGGFRVKTSEGGYVAQRVVLATGTRGRPRRLGVAGENQERVLSLLEDPEVERGRDVLVVGGGDSAVEAAIALCDAGARVTLSYRGDSFSRAQGRNREQMKAYARDGKVTVLLASRVESFGPADVSLTLGDGRSVTLVNHAAYVLIGADAPVAWLEQLGVKYVMRPHWFALGRTDEVVESLLGTLAASPTDAAGCAALILRQPLPVVRAATLKPPPRAVELSPAPRDKRVRPKSLAEAPLVIEATRSRKIRHRTHSPEDTRLLRMLRDEGARLADEESQATGHDSVQTRLPGTPHVVPRSRLGSPSGVPSSAVSPMARGAIPVPPPSLAKGSTLDARRGGKLVPPPPSRSGAYPAKRVVDAFDVKTRVADDAQLVALREESHAAPHAAPDTEAVLDDILGSGPSDDWGGEDHTMIDPNISARFG
jgi:thioredoxin reductase (NADPH)